MAGETTNQQGGALTDLVTVQQNGVRYLGQLIQAIQQTFPNWQAVPTSATAPGVPGQVAYESGFLYVCVAANTWQRTTLSTF